MTTSEPGAATTGLRYNAGKLRYDLLPPDAIAELARVYTRGAVKYAPRNWEKGMAWSTCYASLHRHAAAWASGEDFDEETKCHHMAHVAWNALALVAYAARDVGTDDRAAVPLAETWDTKTFDDALAEAMKITPASSSGPIPVSAIGDNEGHGARVSRRLSFFIRSLTAWLPRIGGSRA